MYKISKTQTGKCHSSREIFRDPRQGRDIKSSEGTKKRLKSRAWQMIRNEDKLDDSLKKKAYAIVISRIQEVISGRKTLQQLVGNIINEVGSD